MCIQVYINSLSFISSDSQTPRNSGMHFNWKTKTVLEYRYITHLDCHVAEASFYGGAVEGRILSPAD